MVVRRPFSLNRAAVWMPFIVHGSLTCAPLKTKVPIQSISRNC